MVLTGFQLTSVQARAVLAFAPLPTRKKRRGRFSPVDSWSLLLFKIIFRRMLRPQTDIAIVVQQPGRASSEMHIYTERWVATGECSESSTYLHNTFSRGHFVQTKEQGVRIVIYRPTHSMYLYILYVQAANCKDLDQSDGDVNLRVEGSATVNVETCPSGQRAGAAFGK